MLENINHWATKITQKLTDILPPISDFTSAMAVPKLSGRASHKDIKSIPKLRIKQFEEEMRGKHRMNELLHSELLQKKEKNNLEEAVLWRSDSNGPLTEIEGYWLLLGFSSRFFSMNFTW